jgi:hypothetical protein
MDPSGHWDYAVATTTTDANSAYTFAHSESVHGKYLFEPAFSGDTYAPAYAVISLTVGAL